MADDVLRVFDQQRAAFDRLSNRIDDIAGKLDAIPSETLREAQKANAELVGALNRRTLEEVQAARRRENRAHLWDNLWFNHIPHLNWIAPLLFAGLIALGLVFLVKPLSQSDTLCGWMGGFVANASTGEGKGCVFWRR